MIDYFTLPDNSTAALTPMTKITLALHGVEPPKDAWILYKPVLHLFHTGECLSSVTLEKLAEMCAKSKDKEKHPYVVDEVLVDIESTYVKLQKNNKYKELENSYS